MTALEFRAESAQQSGLIVFLIWALMAISWFVYYEPAPFDVMAAGLVVFLFVSGLRFPVSLGPPAAVLGIFVICNFVSIMAVDLPFRALWYFWVTIYMLLLWVFFAAVIYREPVRVMSIVWHGYIVAAVIAAVLGIGGHYNVLSSELFTDSGRARGMFKDPNVFAPFLIPVAVYCAARLEASLQRQALINLGIFLLMTLGILLAFSRAAWGHFLGALFLFAVLRLMTSGSIKRNMRIMAVGIVLLLIGGAVVTWLITSTEVGKTFAERAVIVKHYDTGSLGRFGQQLEALRTASNNPVGIGPGQSEFTFFRPPHSLYIRVLVENGWLGALAFFVFLGMTLWRGFKACLRRTQLQTPCIVLLTCVAGVLANSLVIDSLHWRHFFVILGMLWGTILAIEARHERAVAAQQLGAAQ